MKQILLFILILLTLGCNFKKPNAKLLDTFSLAEQYFNDYQTDSAILYYKIYLRNSKVGIDTLSFKSLCKLAICYQRTNERNNLETTYKTIDSVFKNNSNFQKFQIDYLIVNGFKEFYNSNYGKAKNIFLKAMNLQSSINTTIPYLYYKEASCFDRLNQFDSAELYCKKALAFAWKCKKPYSNEIADYYNLIAHIYLVKYTNFYLAKKYYDTVMNVYEHCKYIDKSSYAWNLFQIGYFYHYLGLYSKADQYYSKAYEIFSSLKNDSSNLITLLYYQANINSYLGKFDIAHNDIDRAISYYLDVQDMVNLLESYNEKAYVYYRSNEFKKAIIYYNKVLEILKKRNSSDPGKTFFRIARCYLELNMLDSTKKYFQQSMVLLDKNNNLDINYLALLYSEYSRMWTAEKKYIFSIEAINKNLKIIKNILGEKSMNFGYLIYWKAVAYENMGQLIQSLKTYYDVTDASLDIKINTNIYNIPVFCQSDIIAYDNLTEALTGKARVLSKLSIKTENPDRKIFLLKKSLEHFEKANEVVENHNKQMESENDRLQFTRLKSSIKNNILITSLQLCRLTKNKQYIETAFTAADHCKATQVTLGLKEDEYKRLGGVPENLIQKEKNLQEEISLLQSSIREEKNKNNSAYVDQLNDKLNSYLNASEKLAKQVESNYPRYYQLKFTGKNIDIEHLKQLTGYDKSFIEYALTPDSLYLFVISDKKISCISKPLNGIIDSVLLFRKFLTNTSDSAFLYTNFRQFASLAYWLYQNLLKPVETLIRNKSLVIIPDSMLNLLPFEALTTSNSAPPKADYGMLPYLLYKQPLSYAYSAELYLLQQKLSVSKTDKLLAYAPDYNNVYFKRTDPISKHTNWIVLSPLKGSGEEVKKITKVFGGKSMIGRKASRYHFKKHAYEGAVLHLAMHTILDNDYPMNSKLVFNPSSATSNDGYLNTYEIYNLKLNSPLVVLSACNTGYGKLMKGEGLISLSRGFLYAGCPSMVITLWSVADRSSSSLMQNFYENLTKNFSTDEALQKAKINYISNSDQYLSHPYFWAGYIQTGKTMPVFKETSLNYNVISAIIILIFIVGIIAFFFAKKRTRISNT